MMMVMIAPLSLFPPPPFLLYPKAAKGEEQGAISDAAAADARNKSLTAITSRRPTAPKSHILVNDSMAKVWPKKGFFSL